MYEILTAYIPCAELAKQQRQRGSEHASDQEPLGKFASDVCEMITGDPKIAALGLEDYMKIDFTAILQRFGSKVAAIEAEFKACNDETLPDGKTLMWYTHPHSFSLARALSLACALSFARALSLVIS